MVFNVVPTFFEVRGACMPGLQGHSAPRCFATALISAVSHNACACWTKCFCATAWCGEDRWQANPPVTVNPAPWWCMCVCWRLEQVAMVSAILTVKCGASLAALTCGTLVAYMAFTFSITQVRTWHLCPEPHCLVSVVSCSALSCASNCWSWSASAVLPAGSKHTEGCSRFRHDMLSCAVLYCVCSPVAHAVSQGHEPV
jgi:hypothetical protein